MNENIAVENDGTSREYSKEYLKIYEIENDSKLLDFKTYDEAPIWMIARYHLLYRIVGAKMMKYDAPVRVRKITFKMVSCIIKSIISNIKNKNILQGKKFVLYSMGRETIIEGKYYNRHIDDFYLLNPELTLVIEQSLINWDWPFPRISNNVLFDLVARIIGEVKSRIIKNKDYDEVKKLVLYFVKRVETLTNLKFSHIECIRIEKYISRLIISTRHQADWFSKIISKSKSILCVVMGGLPFPYYFLNTMLKRHSIIAVEFQHGYITRNNIVYNYPPQIVNDPRVKLGLPHYMFTYGLWWNKQINSPVTKVIIGNPYHDNCYNNYINNTKIKNNKKWITIISTGQNTHNYLILLDEISKRMPNRHIRIRAHPGEYISDKDIININSFIEIDRNANVYTSLFESDIVIGEVSTVLFEAIGIADRIFVWNTDYSVNYFPNHPFEHFTNVEELVKKLKNKDYKRNYKIDDFWAPNWKESYEKFFHSIVLKKDSIMPSAK